MTIDDRVLLPEIYVLPKMLDTFVDGVFENYWVNVYHVNQTRTEKSVVVLRDTGAAQIVLLRKCYTN